MKEVRQGYKMTELGEIPSEWEVEKLENLFVFKNGLNKEKEFFGKGTPIVNYTDVFKKRGLLANDIQGKVTVNEKELKNFEVMKGDVFFTRTSETIEEIGLSSVVLEDVKDTVFSGFVLRARPTTLKLNPEYCKYCFSTEEARKEIKKKSSYTTRALTSGTNLNTVVINVPPLPEQQKIADILSTVDEQIDNVDQLIEKTKELKKGLMKQLLTKGIGHTEFKETEVGVIPKEWEVKNLGEIVKFQSGYAFKSTEFIDKGLRVVKITNVQQHNLVWDDINFVLKEFEEKYKDFVLKENDIVLPMTRPIISTGIKACKVAKEDLPCILNQRVGRFVIKQEVLSDYLYQYIFTPYFVNKVDELSSTTGQPNISAKQIEEILIAIPSIKEQKKIVQGLEQIDIKVKEYQSRKLRLEQLKKGLMQQLLTGKIRVKTTT